MKTFRLLLAVILFHISGFFIGLSCLADETKQDRLVACAIFCGVCAGFSFPDVNGRSEGKAR